jgi:hypothetical protein
MEGGAWCNGRTITDVYECLVTRSQTDLGSSYNYPEQGSYDSHFDGNETKDVLFFNWNRFVIKYCDGSGH